ncbi:MAG: tRNA uridine-5-carboxymethylaminomethyl(34) synthesis GTPase MnmE [Spirochaetaceae bacterium]|nr:MAG: tRNA uridine-5-carboxymethylaminomethyl(34) synthesis GTPase MnmE [Spirochaetaceae bacterium]
MYDHPIVAIATPLSPSAISVIRASGSGSIARVATRFSRARALIDAPGHTVVHGMVVTADGAPLDEVLVTVFRAPRSYTGQDSVEVSCHGSPAGVRRVYAELLSAGFAAAEPGEFTRRAFLGGKLDLTQAEAVNEIVRAQTARAHALALDRLDGGVSREMQEIRTRLIAVMARVSIQLDYPEEDTGEIVLDPAEIKGVRDRIVAAAAGFERGRLYQEGVSVALAGRTNAGKSSLFNRIVRHERAIVSAEHGTTRDYLEARIDLDGIPVRLFDTAGLRDSSAAIEAEGIRRSRQIIASCDLIVYVVDAAQGMSDDDRARLDELAEARPIVAWNKIDLVPDAAAAGSSEADASRYARVSATTGQGMAELHDAIVTRLLGDRDTETTGITIDSERQYALLNRAADALDEAVASLHAGMPADVIAVDLQDAIDAIGEITGEVASSEVLDAMFGSFCVGK